MTFLRVGTEKIEGTKEADIEWPRKSVYDYSRLQLLEPEGPIQVTFGTKRREKKLRTLHQSMRMVLGDV